MAEQRCCHFVDMQHKASQISPRLSPHPSPYRSFYLLFSYGIFFLGILDGKEPQMFEFAEPIGKIFLTKISQVTIPRHGRWWWGGGGIRIIAHLCPCTKYAAILFLQHYFPNSLGIPLLFSSAIWFGILLTGVIKLCIHSGHFSC